MKKLTKFLTWFGLTNAQLAVATRFSSKLFAGIMNESAGKDRRNLILEINKVLGITVEASGVASLVEKVVDALYDVQIERVASMSRDDMAKETRIDEVRYLRDCVKDEFVGLACSDIVDIYTLYPFFRVLVVLRLTEAHAFKRPSYVSRWENVVEAFNIPLAGRGVIRSNNLRNEVFRLPSSHAALSDKFEYADCNVKMSLAIAESRLMLEGADSEIRRGLSIVGRSSIGEKKASIDRLERTTKNEALLDLYESNYKMLSEAIVEANKVNDIKSTYPYLIAEPKFSAAAGALNVMLFGISTFGWNGEQNHGDTTFRDDATPERLMSLYQNFINNDVLESKYRSPFWNFYRSLLVQDDGQPIDLVANNLAKVGYVYGNTGFDRELQKRFSGILQREIEIFDPKVCIFAVGHANDSLIEEIFGDPDGGSMAVVPIPGIQNTNVLARLVFSKGVLAGRTVLRTYHPGYLIRIKNEEDVITMDRCLHNLSNIVKLIY